MCTVFLELEDHNVYSIPTVYNGKNFPSQMASKPIKRNVNLAKVKLNCTK